MEKSFIGVFGVVLSIWLCCAFGPVAKAQTMSASGLNGQANIALQDMQMNFIQNKVDTVQELMENIVATSCQPGDFVTGITVLGEVECGTAPVGGIIPTSCAQGQFVAEISSSGSVRCAPLSETGGTILNDGEPEGDMFSRSGPFTESVNEEAGDAPQCPCGSCGITRLEISNPSQDCIGRVEVKQTGETIEMCTQAGWQVVSNNPWICERAAR